MSAQAEADGVDLSRLLARDYWLVLSASAPGTDQAAVDACVPEHAAWLLKLERSDALLASGPPLSGPGVGPGSGSLCCVRPGDVVRTTIDGLGTLDNPVIDPSGRTP